MINVVIALILLLPSIHAYVVVFSPVCCPLIKNKLKTKTNIGIINLFEQTMSEVFVEQSSTNNKQNLGQFYTTNWMKILKNLHLPKIGSKIIEPFVGAGDLLTYCKTLKAPEDIECYDIDPIISVPDAIQQDTLLNPPTYTGNTVITNPPYLARNKSKNKDIFDKYKTNDLYKCFIKEIIKQKPVSGIMIIPLNFWSGMRIADSSIRGEFLQNYDITHLNIFTESVFDDTDYTVSSFSFVLNPNKTTRSIKTTIVGHQLKELTLNLKKEQKWVIGYDVLNTKQNPAIKFVRIVENQPKPPNMVEAKFHLHGLDNPLGEIY